MVREMMWRVKNVCGVKLIDKGDDGEGWSTRLAALARPARISAHNKSANTPFRENKSAKRKPHRRFDSVRNEMQQRVMLVEESSSSEELEKASERSSSSQIGRTKEP